MIRLFSLFALLGVVAGCAAQDSHREYYRAERLLEEAQRASPAHKNVNKAEESLLKGKAFLDDAKYDKASQNFKESIRLSESVVNPEGLEKKLAAKRPAQVPVVSSPSIQTAEPKSAAPAMGSPHDKKSDAPRSLPREALAKYLAGKKSGATKMESSAPALKATPAPLAPSPKQKVEKTQEPEEKTAVWKSVSSGEGSSAPVVPPADAPGLQTSAVPLPETKIEGPVEDGKTFAVDPDLAPNKKQEVAKVPAEVVKVPSKSIDKYLPSAARPASKEAATMTKPKPQREIVKVPDSPAQKSIGSAAAEKPRTKIPGAIFFGANDASIEPDTMMTLDQTSKFLLDNPSTSLMFQGISGPGESGSLIDSRFESLRSYLVGKGVPDDQVRLDSKRRGGSRAEFEMFLIEH